MPIRITIEDFAKGMRHGFVPSIRQAMERGLVDGGIILAQNVRKEIRQNKPYPLVWKRNLLKSVVAVPIRGGSIVGVWAPYAAALEYGTRPFTPPMGPLVEWASDKFPRLTPNEVVNVAFAIRRKIQRQGIRPKFYFRKAIKRSLPDIKRAVEMRVHKAERYWYRSVGRAVLR